MRLKVVSVDMYGYCGGERHPEPSDVGKIGTVVQVMVAVETDVEDQCDKVLGPFDHEARNIAGWNPDANTESMWTVVFPDGTLRDLMDHEVEPVLGGRSWSE
jgi:hypothetical protein